MYTIHIDGTLLYSPEQMDEEHSVMNPLLTMEANSAGSLTFTIPPKNTGYAEAKKLKSIVTVEQDGEEIWRGRIVNDEMDFYKQRRVTCEGDLAFLGDSLQYPYTKKGSTVNSFLTFMLGNHNGQVEEEKQFSVGEIGNADTWDAFSEDYLSTEDSLQGQLVDILGGFLVTRKTNSGYVLDYISDEGRECSQKIEFGKNLLDLKEYINAAGVYTVLVPIGTNSNGDSVSIKSINGNKDYIQDDAAVAMFGKIWRSQEFYGVASGAKLLSKAQKALSQGVAAATTITISAVDLHLLDVDTEKIKLCDSVQVVSEPHGFDRRVVCSRLEIDMVNPDKTVYTFGTPVKPFTERTKKIKKKADNVDNLADSSRTKVSRGGVVSAVNNSPESIVITGNRVNVAGNEDFIELDAEFVKIKNLVTKTLSFEEGTGGFLTVYRITNSGNYMSVGGRTFTPTNIQTLNGNFTVLAVP